MYLLSDQAVLKCGILVQVFDWLLFWFVSWCFLCAENVDLAAGEGLGIRSAADFNGDFWEETTFPGQLNLLSLWDR